MGWASASASSAGATSKNASSSVRNAARDSSAMVSALAVEFGDDLYPGDTRASVRA